MSGLIFVGLGGGLGAMSRYGISLLVMHFYPLARFPLATFSVNFIGCLLIGVLASCLSAFSASSESLKLFLITGFLGGFTTFSAFGLETLILLRRGDIGIAGFNIALSVFCCLFAVWFGLKLGEVCRF